MLIWQIFLKRNEQQRESWKLRQPLRFWLGNVSASETSKSTNAVMKNKWEVNWTLNSCSTSFRSHPTTSDCQPKFVVRGYKTASAPDCANEESRQGMSCRCRCCRERWNPHFAVAFRQHQRKLASYQESEKERKNLNEILKCLIINLDTSYSLLSGEMRCFLVWRCQHGRDVSFLDDHACVGACCFPRSLNHHFRDDRRKWKTRKSFGRGSKMKSERAEMEAH